ncbi:protein FAM222A-like [Denticeps clupeoides]|uniref:Uncharacterized protein n=1 Tax=Denticeps clupeoides TaxID=299321 RepID=A0AAY4BJF9_9TELE|nr:protein FAM222A-like [Denticeps clupeoides]
MLACLQRSQNPTPQHLVCAGKILEAPPPISQKSEMRSVRPQRYPTAAELDAYARRTADNPLSIKIFPTNIRVPQHKHISRTVNGLDTTGQRYSHYAQPYTAGYQGLLAIVRTTAATRGVVKSSDGKRTKLSPAQMAVAPYALPMNGTLSQRLRQKVYGMGHCKPPKVPSAAAMPGAAVATSVIPLSAGQSLPLVQAHLRHTERHPHPQVGQTMMEAQTSPSQRGAPSDSGFAIAGLPQSSLAYSGAVLPTQSAGVTGACRDGVEYTLWHPQQGALRMYGASSGGGAVVSRSPETCGPQLSFRPHPLSGGVSDRVSSSPLNCAAVRGEFSVGQFFAPHWNSVPATPNSDCYKPLELPAASSVGHALHHPHPQLYPAAAAMELCCLPGRTSLCQASVLSSSLQSLESLISEIHPPCIKECMLGRGYEGMGVPRLLEQQPAPFQLPVFR